MLSTLDTWLPDALGKNSFEVTTCSGLRSQDEVAASGHQTKQCPVTRSRPTRFGRFWFGPHHRDTAISHRYIRGGMLRLSKYLETRKAPTQTSIRLGLRVIEPSAVKFSMRKRANEASRQDEAIR
jgi:hypothetical protein